MKITEDNIGPLGFTRFHRNQITYLRTYHSRVLSLARYGEDAVRVEIEFHPEGSKFPFTVSIVQDDEDVRGGCSIIEACGCTSIEMLKNLLFLFTDPDL